MGWMRSVDHLRVAQNHLRDRRRDRMRSELAGTTSSALPIDSRPWTIPHDASKLAHRGHHLQLHPGNAQANPCTSTQFVRARHRPPPSDLLHSTSCAANPRGSMRFTSSPPRVTSSTSPARSAHELATRNRVAAQDVTGCAAVVGPEKALLPALAFGLAGKSDAFVV